MGADSFRNDMDIIRTVRRIRMHGFGLNFLLGTSLREIAARLAITRPLRPVKEGWYVDDSIGNTSRGKWAFIEK